MGFPDFELNIFGICRSWGDFKMVNQSSTVFILEFTWGRGVQLCGFQLVFFYDFILFPLFIIFRATFDFQIPRPTQQKRKKGTLTWHFTIGKSSLTLHHTSIHITPTDVEVTREKVQDYFALLGKILECLWV